MFDKKSVLISSKIHQMAPVALSFVAKKRLRHRCFPEKFESFLRTFLLKNICERRGHSCQNIYLIEFLVTVYLVKKCQPWCILNKPKSAYLSVKFLKL